MKKAGDVCDFAPHRLWSRSPAEARVIGMTGDASQLRPAVPRTACGTGRPDAIGGIPRSAARFPLPRASQRREN